jgi:hypothetical protein
MYRLEVKHAFKMFISKTMNEIKQSFQDVVPEPVRDHYTLLLDNVDKNIEEIAGKHGIEETPEVPGSFGFQIRIVQTEKVVQLHGFAKHKWDKPSVNNDTEKSWGMLCIPVLIQSSTTELAEKYLQRKIEIYINISYLQKELPSTINGKRFGKLKITKSNAGPTSSWEDIDILEQEVTDRLKIKALVGINTADDINAEILEREVEKRVKNRMRVEDAKRGLPLVPGDAHLIDFDKQVEHTYLEIEREPEEMRPVHRVITVREQKILAEVEKKRFDIPQLKLQLSAAAELALRETKLNVSNPSMNTGTYTFEDENSTSKPH